VTPAEAIGVAAAGFGAGAVNAIAGGGSLISFPALLAIGYPALPANVTNTVGLLPGYLGGSLAYRRELAGQRGRLPSLLVAAVLGAGAGAAVMLTTPASFFRTIVPWLVIAGCLMMLLQTRVAALLQRRSERHDYPVPLHIGVFLGGVYGSYFGAALGVMLLALLGMLLPEDLQRLNALKSALSLVVSIVGAVVFAVFGPVVWSVAAVLAGSSLVGGHVGGSLARRMSPRVLRFAVVTFGLVVAVDLLL
jgi:uncharacterized membrane protein YfcA